MKRFSKKFISLLFISALMADSLIFSDTAGNPVSALKSVISNISTKYTEKAINGNITKYM